jgi:hypothetical protein
MCASFLISFINPLLFSGLVWFIPYFSTSIVGGLLFCEDFRSGLGRTLGRSGYLLIVDSHEQGHVAYFVIVIFPVCNSHFSLERNVGKTF